MSKRYPAIVTIWVLLIIAGLVTNSFFPSMAREQLDLYESYEYSQMYLEDDTYTNITIEYDYVDGYGPDEDSMGLLEQKIDEYSDKDSIESIKDEEIRVNDTRTSYDRNDISALKESYRSYGRDGNIVPLHVIYLNGVWENNKNALGLSQQPHQVVIFKGTIRKFAREGDLGIERVESAVLVHEFGHLLSLVGVDYYSEHEASDYPNHCNEEVGECVMAGSVELPENGDADPPPTDFCENCQDDIEKIRGLEGPLGLEDYLNYGIIGGYGLLGIGVTAILWESQDEARKKEKSDYRYQENFPQEETSDYESSNEYEDDDIYY